MCSQRELYEAEMIDVVECPILHYRQGPVLRCLHIATIEKLYQVN